MPPSYCDATNAGFKTSLSGMARQIHAWLLPLRRQASFRFFRDPLAVFMLAGGVIFLAYYLIEAQRSTPISYTPEVASTLVGEFEELSGRKANSTERTRIRDDYIDDELLFREAISRGMHLNDPETRERMIDRMRYIIAGVPPEPTEADLIDYYAANQNLYQREAGTSLDHVFFTEKPANPSGLLAALNSGARIAGDDFWLGRSFPDYGDSMLRGMFGQPFLDALKHASQGTWFGPVHSNRGWHFVRKTGVSGRTRIPYAQARSQVRQDFLLSRTKAALDREVKTLKEKYDVDITG